MEVIKRVATFPVISDISLPYIIYCVTHKIYGEGVLYMRYEKILSILQKTLYRVKNKKY